MVDVSYRAIYSHCRGICVEFHSYAENTVASMYRKHCIREIVFFFFHHWSIPGEVEYVLNISGWTSSSVISSTVAREKVEILLSEWKIILKCWCLPWLQKCLVS